MALLYHPESGCYWYGELTKSDAENLVEDVTGEPTHEANAKEQINPIDIKTGKVIDFMTTIDSNVPPPTEKKKPRGRKPRATEAGTGAANLIKALEFVSLAQKEAGTPYQIHCLMHNHWCVAFDGVLTVGCKIEEDISACPNTSKLLAALKKCGQQVAIAQLNEFKLSVKSERFKATIDCVSYRDLPESFPDPSIAAINDEVRRAFETLAWVAVEGAERPFTGGVLLQANSAVVTNGHVLLEYWHGIDLPPGLVIPKVAVKAIASVQKPLKGFGYSERSATFYFEDESFIKTQLIDCKFPQYEMIFDRYKGNRIVLPKEFFEGLDAVKSFSEDKFVSLRGNKIQSHNSEEKGATFDLEGLPQDISFNYEYLKACAAHFFDTDFGNEGVSFKNGNVRGAIASCVRK